MVAVAPGQIICNGVMLSTGGAITEMVTELVAVQPSISLTNKLMVGLGGVKPNACIVFCVDDV